jgi:predicted RecB family endonuclease
VSVVDLKEASFVTELISELKSVIKSAVIQAIEDVIKPLQDCINKQNDKITSLKAVPICLL